ncbi:MAG: exonuclease SbcCD subunit D [Bacilli bacterium]|nr:exonuclease SbcCD subunit D [Bacilli bacterium]
MKILHLADLHIGKSILEQSLLKDQEYMLEQIIKIIKEKDINTVLIAGDIYDRSIPSTEAINLLDNFLVTLTKELKIKVLIISGNHDSKERLNFGSKLFEKEGLYIQTSYDGNLRKIEIPDEYGFINFYLLPYLKPADVKAFFDCDIENYNDAIKKIIEKETINEKERNIIVSHQFVTSGTFSPERSDSETITLGGTENVDISNYDKFDYVALGHIHRPQKLIKDNIRYSGTILKYSFSEVNHNKTVPIIEYKEKGNLTIELIPLVPARDMRIIKGPIDELLKKENYLNTNLDDYIEAIITDEEPVYDAINRIRRVYPNTLKLDILNNRTRENEETHLESIEKIKEKTELELFNEFFKFQNNEEMNKKEEKIIKEIINELRKEE